MHRANSRIERRSDIHRALAWYRYFKMAMSITRRDIDKAHAMVRRQQAAAERDQARRESYTGQLMQSAEVGAGALASGILSGRFGAVSFLNGLLPLDLISGLALHALGFSRFAGKYSDDAHNVADGMLAAYLVKLGAGLGTEWRIRSGLGAFAPVTAGDMSYGGAFAQASYPAAYFPPTPAVPDYAMAWNQGGGLTEADLAAMAAMA